MFFYVNMERVVVANNSLGTLARMVLVEKNIPFKPMECCIDLAHASLLDNERLMGLERAFLYVGVMGNEFDKKFSEAIKNTY